MNTQELAFILQEGEGLKIEFKESVSNIDKEVMNFVEKDTRVAYKFTRGISKEISRS